MQQITSFLLRNKHSLLFLFLLSIALGLTIQSHTYHRSKFINTANAVSGGVFESASSVQEYFNLKPQNQQLLEENARLRSYLTHLKENNIDAIIPKPNELITDSIQYEFIPARVIDNNYAGIHNYITLKAGSKDSVQPEMGVITNKGIVGITQNISKKYSTVLSLLNIDFSTNAKLKNSEHFGNLSWDGQDPNEVILADIQQQAPVKVGDTIETSGKSAYFPKGIPIGTISKATLDASGNFYTLRITLFNDMTSLGYVYVIRNNDGAIIKALGDKSSNEE